jgi:hypothetical protein
MLVAVGAGVVEVAEAVLAGACVDAGVSIGALVAVA